MPNTTGFSKNNVPDNISTLLDAKQLVPKKFRFTDKYLDVVSWNIRWFDASDGDRVKAIVDILAVLNADFLVLTEIADDGAMTEVCNQLAQAKAAVQKHKMHMIAAAAEPTFPPLIVMDTMPSANSQLRMA